MGPTCYSSVFGFNLKILFIWVIVVSTSLTFIYQMNSRKPHSEEDQQQYLLRYEGIRSETKDNRTVDRPTKAASSFQKNNKYSFESGGLESIFSVLTSKDMNWKFSRPFHGIKFPNHGI